MLNPKPRAELPFRPDETPGWGDLGPAEPRSFAPRGGATARMSGNVETPEPRAWADILPENLIRLPREAANAQAPLDP
jgi:hypothetical protein